MRQTDPKQVIAFLNRLYMRLLIICPPTFRQVYANEIAHLLCDYGRDVYQQQGIGGFLLYWLRAIGDLMLIGLQERWECFMVQRQRSKQMERTVHVNLHGFGEQVVQMLERTPAYYSLLTDLQPSRAFSELAQYLALDVDLAQPGADLHLFKGMSITPTTQSNWWLAQLSEGVRRTYANTATPPTVRLEQLLQQIYTDEELFHLLAADEIGAQLFDLVDCLALDGDTVDLADLFQLLQALSTPAPTLASPNEEVLLAANQRRRADILPVQPAPGDHSLHWHYERLADTFCALAEDCLAQARYAEGLALLNSTSLHWLEQAPPSPALIRLQLQRARLLFWQAYPNADQATYDQALAILLAAEPLARFLDDQPLLAELLHWIGVLYYSKEWGVTTLATPLRYFEAALALRRTLADQRGIAESLLGVGWVYQHKLGADEQDAARALAAFQETYQLATAGNFLREKATAIRHLGVIHWWRGEQEAALQQALEFLAIQETLGFQPELPPAYFSVGFAYLDLHDLDNASLYFEKLRALAEANSYQRYLAEALIGLGLVQERRQEKSTALTHYRAALDLAERIGFQRVVTAATTLIAQLAPVVG